ncbi:unnamed protein product [Fraxinus pennsylvanica]|uniref:Uncharacterized protein n=1 Tax=Fraxinus pennsylvanica TaxID=56036 RepID=A0AAD1Z3J3_9LAMI|nr:unnamed protein product [Fraxinus pennsylvanica]
MGENGGGSKVCMQKNNESRDFGESSRKTRPCQDFRLMKHLKYGQGENASLCAIGLEKQEQEISHKRSGEDLGGTGCKEKRSRCLHLPEVCCSRDLGKLRKRNFEEHNEPHCSTVSPPNYPIEGTVRGKKLKLKMELKTRDLSRRTAVLPLGNVSLNLSDDFEDQSVDEFKMKTVDSLGFGAGEIHNRNGMETELIDVHLTVQASYQAEHVPFVCLVSKLNRKAILGHPVEIEEIADSSRTCPRFHRLVWKTSKRSPVIYVTNSCASSTAVDNQALRDALRENVLAGDPKFLKKPGQFKQGTVPLRRTCVPVKHIFILTSTASPPPSSNPCTGEAFFTFYNMAGGFGSSEALMFLNIRITIPTIPAQNTVPNALPIFPSTMPPSSPM